MSQVIQMSAEITKLKAKVRALEAASSPPKPQCKVCGHVFQELECYAWGPAGYLCENCFSASLAADKRMDQ